MTPQRIQMRRVKGWRKPPGAVYVGRPSPYGNPFPIDSSWVGWMAIAMGLRWTQRREAAVALHRAWITNSSIRLREYAPIQNGVFDGGALEFGDGSVVPVLDHIAGIATLGAATTEAPRLPERPDLEPLRGRDLLCWCPLDAECHAQTLLELANGAGVTPADHYGLDGR